MKTLQHTPQLGGALVRQAAIAFGLLAVGLVLSLATFARGSQLQLSLWNKGDFTVEICGERYYADGQLTLRDLPPGQQRVRVMQRRNNHCGNGGQVSMLYNGFINVPRNSKVIACVRPNRQVRIVDIIRHRPAQQGCHSQHGGGQFGRPSRHGDRPQAHYDEGYGHVDYGHYGQGQGQCGQGTYGNGGFDTVDFGNHHDTPVCDMHGQLGCTCGGGIGAHHDTFGGRMTSQEMNRLVSDLENAGFESERFLLAQQRLRGRTLTSIQAKRIMMQFWFEDTKLRFAKFAYSQTTDPGNFWVVNDAFQFQNSVHELDEFIQFNN
jgi:hypothetical protein